MYFAAQTPGYFQEPLYSNLSTFLTSEAFGPNLRAAWNFNTAFAASGFVNCMIKKGMLKSRNQHTSLASMLLSNIVPGFEESVVVNSIVQCCSPRPKNKLGRDWDTSVDLISGGKLLPFRAEFSLLKSETPMYLEMGYIKAKKTSGLLVNSLLNLST